MKPYYEADGISIYHADCRDVDVSGVSAVVTDPPYGLEFMGKGWDKGVPGVEFWDRFAGSCWPGAHLVAFGGTRTHHRLMCAIEDSGWEIRDCLMWLYGSGFPKSLDVGKAIDKAAAAEREDMGPGQWAHVKAGGTWKSNVYGDEPAHGEGPRASKPASDAAKQWDGWGTALKPAWEPIVLARKPLPGTVAANVQEYGTGAINVDGCRILAPPGDREEYGIDGDEDAGRNRIMRHGHLTCVLLLAVSPRTSYSTRKRRRYWMSRVGNPNQ
jgi:site-specific DNA-methyltransferase (adenine-specific)